MQNKQFGYSEWTKRKKLNMSDLFASFIWKIEPGLEQGWNAKEDERKKNEALNWDPSDFQKYAWWKIASSMYSCNFNFQAFVNFKT